MAKKKKDTVEFRFYEVPQGEAALVLHGEPWRRTYGHENLRLHFHNLMEIGICRQGLGNMHMNKEIYRYADGTITVIPENYPHHTVSDGEETNFWEYIFIDLGTVVGELFPGDPIYQSKIARALNEKGGMMTDAESDKRIAGLIDAVIEETKSEKPFSQKIKKLQVQELVAELIRKCGAAVFEEEHGAGRSNMKHIAAALDYIGKNYDQEIRVSDLADICGMSETHFRRVFQSYVNMTPMDYVNLSRIQKACELMKKSDLSMDMVAVRCGFATTSTFNRNFRKFLDISPYQWKINPENYESKLLDFKISALKGW